MVTSFFYILFFAFLLIPLLPFLLIIALLIAFTSGRPILFTQKRIGKNNQPFLIYKYRTMGINADKKQRNLRDYNEAKEPAFKIHDDPRFTGIGKFLSHTGLDELPQLWNVVKGEMSLIGPRPLPLSEAKQLKPWQQARHQVKPGIISPWVLNGYHSNSFDEWMKSDILYAQQKTLAGDLILFLNAGLFWLHLLWRQLKESLSSPKPE
jgi:lipopolysaccharide/colanic/teichoic acid biosynthesis glycosyltransferase